MRTRTGRSFASYAVLVLVLVCATGPAVADSARILGLSVDRSTLRSGQVLTATATSDSACTWTVSWNGEVRRSTGTVARATFTAPPVKKRTLLPLRAACYPLPAPDRRPAAAPSPSTKGPSQRITVEVPAAQARVLTITVLPRKAAVQPPDDGGDGSGNGGGDLPGTGGPDRNVLLAALGAVLAGLALIVAGSRGRRGADPA